MRTPPPSPPLLSSSCPPTATPTATATATTTATATATITTITTTTDSNLTFHVSSMGPALCRTHIFSNLGGITMAPPLHFPGKCTIIRQISCRGAPCTGANQSNMRYQFGRE
ncbi:MAG: hypothetical protein E7450_07255 [Ruminococcaceae bacterium]|nr:hypothetical protein [Oscillospiraceae bacterium]